jgi:hypothetical protein
MAIGSGPEIWFWPVCHGMGRKNRWSGEGQLWLGPGFWGKCHAVCYVSMNSDTAGGPGGNVEFQSVTGCGGASASGAWHRVSDS